MNFAGLVKTSLIDYPGKVAAIVFTQGCNFRCGFCHNPDLIPLESEDKSTLVSEEEVVTYLEKRKNILDGVVVTGGEPLIQAEIKDFIKKVKSLGLLVKLDTNGSNPGLLKSLIEEKLVDYIAMDIKAAPEGYPAICKYSDISKIEESIKIVMDNNVEYEFRTTVLPYYHQLESFDDLGKSIKGAKKYTVQGFRPRITFDERLEKEKSFTVNELDEISKIMKKYVKEVIVHNNLG